MNERARVPFALVGVVLLVSSATYVAGFRTQSAAPEPAVDAAVERTTADARAALRDAAVSASAAAARNPVLSRANSSTGSVLDPNRTFRDALELRIYVAARERFAGMDRRHRTVRAAPSLAATPNASALRRAKERISINRTGPNGTRLRVRLSNVTITARHGGRVVGRTNETMTVVVDSPVLAVHDRVERYQERLNRGIQKPGLNQRVTARLYPIAWARGYAQYGGTPIENVVANRHVALATNSGLLAEQRAVFGRADHDGRRAFATAAAKVGLLDIVGGLRNNHTAALLAEKARTAHRLGTGPIAKLADGSSAPGPEDEMEIDADRAADAAYLSVTRYGTLERTIRDVYEASFRPITATRRVSGGKPEVPDPPGDDWRLVDRDRETTVLAVESADEDAPPVTLPDGWHRFRTIERTVTVRHERERVYRHNGTTRTRATNETEDIAVTVAVAGRHATSEFAPDRPIETVHERGGPLDGENLADLVPSANHSVVDRVGGPDELAERAATGTLDDAPRNFTGVRPPKLRMWIRADLASLAKRVRNVSTTVERGRLATFDANPSAKLADELRARRGELLDAPAKYGSVAEKARVAVRARYLDTVIASLEQRAAQRADRGAAFESALSESDAGSLGLLRRSRNARGSDVSRTPADGPLPYHVDGEPPYLTLTGVSHEQVPAVESGETMYPLAAENVNLATIPTDEIAGTIVDAVVDRATEDQTSLGTAAASLRAANRTLAETSDPALAFRRAQLLDAVRQREQGVRDELVAVLARRGVGSNGDERRAIVGAGLSEWDTVHGRALALANQSAAEPIAAAAAERSADGPPEDLLALELREAMATAVGGDDSKVEAVVVNETARHVKSAVQDASNRAVDAGAERAEDAITKKVGVESLVSVPRGIPITPIPGHWYATMNAWTVRVDGRYARFAVETPRRTPSGRERSLTYVRDGSNVTLDVDGDGERELLGRADRVSFTVETGVVVVVPAGQSGVGDAGGDPVEQSKAWQRSDTAVAFGANNSSR